jgi:peptidoglycan/LPS O-acetylase OafA/YrhL
MIATPHGSKGLHYRPDIDGLRAVAVLAVVFYHVKESLLPGGFAGVDVFFVISGFLITGNLHRRMGQKTFTFADFYRRRLLRIFPPLIVVILATVLVGHFIMLPEDLLSMSRSAVASMLSVANIYFLFFLDTSYFAADASVHPLLHLWSLGVEEQFYIFWPFVLLALMGRGPRILILVTLVIGAASFLLAELVVRDHPMFAYYMLPTRAGQLMAGALVYFMTQGKGRRLPGWLRDIVALAGLVVVGASLWFIDGSMPYPGVAALPVTLGTAAVIWAGTTPDRRPFANSLLGLRPFVWIGLLSYSFYLWHWPVFGYWKYLYGEFSLLSGTLAVLVALGLSWLTCQFVESRYRRVGAPLPLIVNRTFVLPTVAVALAFAALQATDGLGGYAFTSYKAEYNSKNSGAQTRTDGYVCQEPELTERDIANVRCNVNAPDDDPRILLWGDSNAAHYVGMLAALGSSHGFSFKNLAHSSCPPFYRNAEDFVAGDKTEECRRSSGRVVEVIDQFDGVILSASWPGTVLGNEAGRQHLVETVDWLRSKGISVTLLGKTPVIYGADPQCGLKSMKLPFLNCTKNAQVESIYFRDENAFLEDVAKNTDGVTYFDVTDFFCQGTQCSAYLDGVYAYRDSGHLNTDGSWWVGQKINQRLGLPDAFAEFPEISPGPVSDPDTLRQALDGFGEQRFEGLQGGVTILDGLVPPDDWRLSWNGRRYGTSGNGTFALTDDRADSFRVLNAKFSPGQLFEDLDQDSASTVIIEVVLDLKRSTSETLAAIVRSVSDKQERLDLVTYPEDEEIYLKQLANDFNTHVEYEEDEVRLFLAFVDTPNDELLEIRILAAASNGAHAYSAEGIGTTAIRSVKVYLER